MNEYDIEEWAFSPKGKSVVLAKAGLSEGHDIVSFSKTQKQDSYTLIALYNTGKSVKKELSRSWVLSAYKAANG